jgi:amino acid transporter
MVCTYYRAFMFLAYTGAFFTLSYSPLKAIIQGTPKALWPAPMTKLNAVGMPTTAMWLQCLLVSLFILLVSFGGDTASAFYNKLTLMANVHDAAVSVPGAGVSVL